tara:strand:- start:993 stop:1784 length:792 start_codon:yes stop_codon:yes gene_type:complete
MNNNDKTIGLIRVSSHTQDDLHEGTGLQFQLEKVQQYVKLHDYNLIDVVSDVCSGSYETRDGIDKVKSMIKNTDVNRILIWNTSRLFRSMSHFSNFYEFCKKHNVELVSISENISSFSKTGSMIFGIMCSISQYEREIITERMMSGKITKLKNGERKFGGKIVYGYNKDYTLNDEQSEIVKYIFKRVNTLKKRNLTKTKITQSVLKSLRTKGYKFNNNDFTNRNLKSILNNKFYIGEMSYGKITTRHNYDTIVSTRLFNQVSN